MASKREWKPISTISGSKRIELKKKHGFRDGAFHGTSLPHIQIKARVKRSSRV